MENKDISQIVLEKIKTGDLKPRSKYFCNLRKSLFWLIILVAMILGVISFSVILTLLIHNDWDLYRQFGFPFIFKTLPYFWLISLILFAIFAEFFYKKTTLGHRRSILIVILVYMAFTLVLGIAVYAFRGGRFVEKSIYQNIPMYQNVFFKQEVWWNPKEGLLSGTIISIGDRMIEIIDFKKNIWQIDIQNVSLRNRVILRIGEEIKILGVMSREGLFLAKEIRPWFPGGERRPSRFGE